MARLVVLAHRVPFPPNKGEKLRTFHQIEELVRVGHKVTVLAPYEDESDCENAKHLAAKFQIEVICERLPTRSLRLALALLQNKSFSETNFYSRDLMRKFEICAKNADAILLTASSLATYVFKLDVKLPLFKMMDFMDVDSDKWLQYANDSGLFLRTLYKRESKKIRILEKRVAQSFDATFVIAEPEKRLFSSKVANTDNMQILGNGIDQALFFPAPHKPEDSINFLFSGVMDYKPNIDAVLWFVNNCWPTIQQQLDNAHLIIAGMNPSQEIIKLGLANNIEVTGFVDDIKPYFDKAHIFIAPFQIARGVQNKVLQAMACALPVVSTKLGAEGILCENEHDILIAETSEQFVKQVLALANSETYRRDIGQRALKTINNNYAWQSVLMPLTESIKSL